MFFETSAIVTQVSGCGSVGRAVAFESSNWRNFIRIFTINCIEKTKMKKKEAGNCTFLKNSRFVNNTRTRLIRSTTKRLSAMSNGPFKENRYNWLNLLKITFSKVLNLTQS